MSTLAEYSDQLCQSFRQMYELTEDQAKLYQEMRKAVKDKAWTPLNQNLGRMETIGREQGRLSKKILELRTQLQKQLYSEQILKQECDQLLKISELLPLLPEEQRGSLREIWLQLRGNLTRRQSELQVLQNYSEDKQKMIEGFLAALKDDEQDRGQVYGRAGQFNSGGAAAPSRIFSSEA